MVVEETNPTILGFTVSPPQISGCQADHLQPPTNPQVECQHGALVLRGLNLPPEAEATIDIPHVILGTHKFETTGPT